MAFPGMTAVPTERTTNGHLGATETLWWIGCELDGRMMLKVKDENSQGHWAVGAT